MADVQASLDSERGTATGRTGAAVDRHSTRLYLHPRNASRGRGEFVLLVPVLVLCVLPQSANFFCFG